MPGPGVIIAMVLVVVLIFFGFDMITKGKESTDVGISSALYCNNYPNKLCACFFENSSCPQTYVIRGSSESQNKYCPPNNVKCTLADYEEELKKAKKSENYGACCINPEGAVSPSRLNAEFAEELRDLGVID